MTKQEKKYCENLAKEVKRSLENADENFAKYERFMEDNNTIEAECAMRMADYQQGYAEGIYQALTCIEYTSETMKELTERI